MNRKIFLATSVLCATAYLLNRPLPPRAEVRPVAGHTGSAHLKDAAIERSVRSAIGSMPLRFEENAGQADARVKYLARGSNFQLALEPQQASLLLHTPHSREKRPPQLQPQGQGWGEALASARVVSVQFEGALPDARLTGVDPQPGTINYIHGNDPSRWQRNVPHYSRVRDQGIYPGIDAVFYGDRRRMEYDFVVAPGADPSAIRMRVEGADSVELTEDGGVVARTPAGAMYLLAPRLYQQGPGGTRGAEVAGRYVRHGRGEIGFEVAAYNAAQTLVIDPPVSVQRGSGPRKGHRQGSPPPDVPTPTGDAVALSTQLGGSYDDSIQAISIGATSGHVYVAGFTDSYDFPLVGGQEQDYFAGSFGNGSCFIPQFPCGDAFVAEFDISTISVPVLVNTTYLGGSGDDVAWGMDLDSNDNVYLVGETNSGDFPMNSNVTGYQTSVPLGGCTNDGILRPCRHVFFSQLDSGLANLLYSTYLAGSDDDEGYAVTVNSTGQAFLTGVAGPNFPTTACQGDCVPYQSDYVGAGDAFVAEIDPSPTVGGGLNSLIYSTYLGGDGTDIGFAISVGGGSHAYVGGVTYSTITNTPFPTTGNAVQQTTIDLPYCGPGFSYSCGDGFVAILDSQGSNLTYSTLLGGSYADQVNAITYDGAGNIYATGQTQSYDFIPVADCSEFCGGTVFQSNYVNGYDAFVVSFNFLSGSGPSQLNYATYLGGSNDDIGLGIAIDINGNAYVSGTTGSGNLADISVPFPITPNALQATSTAGAEFNTTSFVSVLDPAGQNLIFSTFYGGSQDYYGNPPTDTGNAIALDQNGLIYLAGRTTSFATPDNSSGLCLIHPVSGALNDENYYPDYNGFLVVINPTNVPAACFQPTTANTFVFAPTVVGFTSGSQGPTIFNQGSADMTNSISFTGANPADFPVTNACPTIAKGGTSCPLLISFKPQTTTLESATLVLTNNSAGSPFMIQLQGQGLPPATATLLGPGNTSPLAFGNVTVNTTSTLAATLTNTSGASPLDVSSAMLTGAPGPSPDFSISGDGCSGSTVQAGNSCLIFITYAPTAVGAATPATQLSVGSDGVTNPITLAITGAGVAGSPNPPVISLPTFPLTFAPQTQGTTSTAQNVTITNTAAAGASSLNVTLGFMPASSDFTFAPGTCVNPVPPANGTCTFMVSFKPTTTGPLSATLQITSNASNGTQNITLSGTGLGQAMAAPAPGSLTFSGEPVSTPSSGMNVTLTNTGGSNLTVSGLSFMGANPLDFSATGCTNAVAPNNGCTIVVTFTPQPPGPPAGPAARSATLQIASNASNGTQNVTLNGTALAPATATPAPSPLTFATPQAVMTSSTASVTLSNTGGATLSITSVQLTGGNTGDFAITSNGCGNSLGAGGNCVVAVTFTPQATGLRMTTLQFTDSLGMQNVTVSGTGVTGASAALAPAGGITFTTPQQIFTTSPTMPATLTNSGGAALSISSIAASGDFSAVSNNCGISLGANSACTINVAYTPTAVGTSNGTLTVMDAVGTQSIMLSGMGFASGGAQASLSSPLYFGAVLQGSTSGAQMVTITNTGGAPLTVMSAVASAQFGATNNCTMALTSGQSCMISVTFSPTTMGTVNGTLMITDNAPNSPQIVPLSGLGATFTLAPPAGSPSSLTVNPGDTANFSVGFTSTPGLIAPITLTCSSTAPYTICKVSPSMVTLGGPTPPTVTVTLQTNCIGQLVGPRNPVGGPFSGMPAPIGAIWAAVLLLFAMAQRKRATGKAERWAGRLVPICAALVLVLLVAGFSACVSNNPPAIPGSPTTPAGTYNVTVMAAASGGQLNVTKLLNLVVRVI